MLAIALVCVLMVMSMGAYGKKPEEEIVKKSSPIANVVEESLEKEFTSKTLEIKIIRHESYLDKYGKVSLHYRDVLFDARVPFLKKWNITLRGNTLASSLTPITSSEYCDQGYNNMCNSSYCGLSCVNSFITDENNNHHKNIFSLENEMYLKNLKGASDLQVTYLSLNACNITNNQHMNNIVGLGNVGGRYSIINDRDSYLLDVRVLQHELSHNFGCQHHEPLSEEPCIMTGGYDKELVYDLENIWCSVCQVRFDPNKF